MLEIMSDNLSAQQLKQTLEQFNQLAPWNQFDEWTGISIELTGQNSNQRLCAFFGEDQEADFKLLILRGEDPSYRYRQYRNGEWIPEFGLDFATTDGIKVSIQDDQIISYVSSRCGHPDEELRIDEKEILFEVLGGINFLIEQLEAEKVPLIGESEEYCYHLWKVGTTWRADVKEFPEEQLVPYQPIEINPDRIKRINAAKLPRDGVWEATPFYLPVTRVQGDQEVYVQCAAIGERSMGLLGLVTLEAHADPEQEIVEAVLGSIEKQMRIPQFIIVKEEKVAERILPILLPLGIHIRLRRNLRELEQIREEMIEKFPEDDEDRE